MDQLEQLVRHLLHRYEHRRSGCRDAARPHVAEHADDLARVVVEVADGRLQPRAEHRPTVAQAPDVLLVDKRHGRRPCAVVRFAERPAGHERDAQNPQVVSRHVAPVDASCDPAARSLEQPEVQTAFDRQVARDRGGFDAGYARQLVERPPIERRHGDPGPVFGTLQRGAGGEHVGRLEAECRRVEPDERAQEHALRGEQHRAQRDLADHERSAQPSPAHPGRAARRPAVQRVRGSAAGGEKAGQETESQAGRERDPQRSDQRRRIDGDPPDVELRLGGDEPAYTPDAGEKPHRPARRRQQDALGQELSEQAASAGAKRGTDGQLPAASHGARQLQPGRVGADDQQNGADGRGEQPDHAVAAAGQHVPIGLHARPRPVGRHGRQFGEHRGELVAQAHGQRQELGLRLRGGPPRGEPADQTIVPVHAVWIGPERRPRVGLLVRPEVGRHDPDDGVRPAAQPHHLPDDARVALEVAGPDGVTQHDRRRIGLVLAQEGASELRLDSEDAKEARRHPEARDECRPAVAGEIDPGGAADACQRRKGLAVVARERNGRLRVGDRRAGPARVHDHVEDAVRLGEGQGTNEHGVDHADHHGRGAEAEPEDHHRRDRETGVLRQGARANSQVLPQIGEKLPPAPLPLPTPVDADARRPDPRVVAEAALRLGPGLGRVAALAHESLGQLADVEVELRVDVRSHVGSPEPDVPPPHRCSRHRSTPMRPGRPGAPGRPPPRTPSTPRSRS